MIERTCPNCGKSYMADPKRLKYGRQTTCSRECSYALRGAAKERSLTFTCQVCGKVFERKPFQHRAKHVTVCSLACYGALRAQGEFTPRPPTKPRITFTCEICGKEVSIAAAVKGARRNRFCSKECADKWNRGANSPKWRGGHPLYYGPDWRPLQRATRKRDGYACRRCGIAQSNRAHDVHHIKPVSSFAVTNDANTLDNVVTLCHNCHQWVEWNGIDFPL